jgi:hypothetical protein
MEQTVLTSLPIKRGAGERESLSHLSISRRQGEAKALTKPPLLPPATFHIEIPIHSTNV